MPLQYPHRCVYNAPLRPHLMQQSTTSAGQRRREARQQGTRIAEVLHEAQPYLRPLIGRPLVLKLGGSTLVGKGLLQRFADDIVLLQAVGAQPLIVHGGGPHITALLRERGLSSHFVNGLRVTPPEVMGVVAEALGNVNDQVVAALTEAGATPRAWCGGSDSPLQAEFLEREKLGRVGRLRSVETGAIEAALAAAQIPVIAPLGLAADDPAGGLFNINADTVAAQVAGALGAIKLILLTDVEGVRSADGELLAGLTSEQARELIASGVVEGGMLPKLESALKATTTGVPRAHIIDARVAHATLIELCTDRGIGTLIEVKEAE